jgi:putative transposase
MWYYKTVKDDSELIAKLNELANQLPTRGLDEYVGRLRAQGYPWNRKRIYRVYKMMRLEKRRKRKRRLPTRNPEPLTVPTSPNKCWSMDFMSDALENGRRLRVLNIIDDFNREALWIDAQYSYPSEFVIRALQNLEVERGLPEKIRVDNGPEFISHKLRAYCKAKGVKLEHIKPGTPTQNAYVERFNRHFREDVLDAYLFSSLSQVNIICHKWKQDYNDNHPHRSLGYHSPNVFKELYRKEIIYSETVKAIMNDSFQSPALTVST